MKKGLSLVVLLLAIHVSFAQKAFDEYYIDKAFQPFSSYTERALPTTGEALVTVDPATVVNNVRQSLFGNNAVGWQGNLDTTRTKEGNWKNASYSMLRYPGGNWSNLFFWDGNLPATIKNESALNGNTANLKSGSTGWLLGTDEFPELLSFTKADGIVCVNVGYAFYGTSADPVSTAANYAADWVDYYNNVLGVGVTYWELGNENYGPWQAGFDLGSAQQYADACLVFASAMKAKDPSIKIGVVLYEGYGGFNNSPQAKDWNETVLPVVQDIMDYAIIHHYPHPNNNRNDISESAIYDAVSVVEETVDMMHDQTTTYTNKPAGHYPIAITEFNARTGVRELSRTNVLFTTLMLGEYASYDDYGATMQWDLQNGYDSFGGNHAAIATKDPFMTDGDANASLYVYYFMERYFGDQLVSGSSNDPDIVVYPTTFDSGELGVVLVNKSNSDNTVEIDLGGFTKGDRMYWHTVDGDDSDFDRTIYINEQGPGTTFNVGQTYTNGSNSAVATAYEANGVGGPQNYTEIDPFSAPIPAGNVHFDAPKYSVSFIVFESAGSDCAVPELGPDQSLCGETSITLSTGLDPSGLSFTWKDGNGTTVGSNEQYVVSSTGTYTVTVDNGTCQQSDEITITDHVTSIDLGGDIHLCTQTSALLETHITNPEVDVEWTKDGEPISGASSIEVTNPGFYQVTASATGCASSGDGIIVTSDLVNTTGDTVCMSGQLATLTINDSGDFGWYDAAENGTLLATTTSYDVSVSETTTYYVQNENASIQQFGKTAIDGATYNNTGAGAYDNTNRTTILTVEQEFVLESLTIFVHTDGADVVLNISGPGYSNSWNFDNLSNAGDGKYVAILNTTLLPGTYILDLVGTTGGVKIQYDNAGSQELEGFASFYTGGGNTTWYGMFFDWVIRTGSACSRTPVIAVLDESPGCVTGTMDNPENIQGVYPNPTTGWVHLPRLLDYELYSPAGVLLLEGRSDQLNVSSLDAGVYMLKTESGTFKLVKD